MKTFTPYIEDKFENNNKMLFERITGSRLYGTQYEMGEHPFFDDYVSDWDFRGVFLVDPKVKLNLPPFNQFEKNLKADEYDIEYYELEKFLKEATRNNPNHMDLLFGDDESLVGASDAGKYLLEHKNMFLTNALGASFEGFANSQLHRMKNHKKWFTRYPDIYDVEETLMLAYENKHIDANSISKLFSGSLSKLITKEDANDKKIKSSMAIEEMLIHYFGKKDYDITKYMKPVLFDFISLYSGYGVKLPLLEQDKVFLKTEATFKKQNESLFFIYDGGEGVFSDDRTLIQKIKKRPTKNDAFKFLMTMNYTKYKSETENIKDLWKWKTERNTRRSELERRFGYDVKHAMHTYRLLDSAIETFENGTYTPRLTGKRLSEAKDVLAGVHSYDEILNLADEKIKILRTYANKKVFPDEPNYKKINEIYMDIIYNKK